MSSHREVCTLNVGIQDSDDNDEPPNQKAIEKQTGETSSQSETKDSEEPQAKKAKKLKVKEKGKTQDTNNPAPTSASASAPASTPASAPGSAPASVKPPAPTTDTNNPCKTCAIPLGKFDNWDERNRFRSLYEEFGTFETAKALVEKLNWKVSKTSGNNI